MLNILSNSYFLPRTNPPHGDLPIHVYEVSMRRFCPRIKQNAITWRFKHRFLLFPQGCSSLKMRLRVVADADVFTQFWRIFLSTNYFYMHILHYFELLKVPKWIFNIRLKNIYIWSSTPTAYLAYLNHLNHLLKKFQIRSSVTNPFFVYMISYKVV